MKKLINNEKKVKTVMVNNSTNEKTQIISSGNDAPPNF
jgi:hypothetical protein